jgi:hypothetical protein
LNCSIPSQAGKVGNGVIQAISGGKEIEEVHDFPKKIRRGAKVVEEVTELFQMIREQGGILFDRDIENFPIDDVMGISMECEGITAVGIKAGIGDGGNVGGGQTRGQ